MPMNRAERSRQQKRDKKAAEASYRKALNTHPNYAEAHSNLGLVLQDIGKPEERGIIKFWR